MATPPPKSNIGDTWTPEPELQEKAPRRIEAVSEYPDLNKPNVVVYSAVGGALAVLGLVVFVLGLTGKGIIFTFLGILLIGAGVVLFVLVPQKAKAHEERARNLVMNGLVFGANVLTSQNMTGDSTYGRSVRYQVVTPSGEMVHKDVNADERRLPKSIPGKATVLMDPVSGDVELYCALPFRAQLRPGTAPPPTPVYTPVTTPVSTPTADPLAGLPISTPQPTSNSGSMGTIGTIGTPVTRERQGQNQTQDRTTPKPEPEPAKTPTPTPNTTPSESDNKLPWE